MSKRMWLLVALAGGAVALSGCVVVPDEPVYGYGGYGAPAAVVRVAPPPVVVVPPPRRYYWGGHRHRHYDHDRRDRRHGGRYGR